MAFNSFASATSSIPLANLDANFTAIGTGNDAASTLYPTATTSITYGAAATNHIFNTTGNTGVGVSSPTSALHLRAGTATNAPLKLSSGTNLTTAEVGAVEYDGTALYATGTSASGRGVILAPTLVRVNTTRNKATNNTSLEAIFDSANDTLTLAANTLYYFRGMYILSTAASASAAALTLGFIFSNAQQDIGYRTVVQQYAFSATQYSTYTTTASAVTVSFNSTSVVNYMIEVEGWFKSNATTGGTVVPSFAQSIAGTSASPTANPNTWLMIQPMSSTPTATLIAGNWT